MPRFNFREDLSAWLERSSVQGFIITLIVTNGVILGIQTSAALTDYFGNGLYLLDQLILAIFVLEIMLKLIANGRGFFRSYWNLFDFFVVAIALVPASGPFAVLRVLRVLRLLRLISVVPRLRFVVEALLHAIPGIASIGILILILFYVFAVVATGLYGGEFPEWFGSLGRSMFTLFQIMTLESWSMGIVRPVMQAFPFAWIFFVLFILVATFTMLNLFIGVIVETMQTLHASSADDQPTTESSGGDEPRSVADEIRALRKAVSELNDRLEKMQK